MTEEKRPLGRPRQYETDSEKVSAFRRRLGEAGYLRKEVLVRKPVEEKLSGLAKSHGVSFVDVASALLEHGLSHYEREQAAGQLSPVLMTQSSGALPLANSFLGNVSASMRTLAEPSASFAALSSPLLDSAPGDNVDPIQQFFAMRKEVKK